MKFSFTETPYFTDRLVERMSDDEYARLQNFLLIHPTVGNVIQGTGGIRKMRWVATGRGKRGGFRIIYYLALSHDRILMLDIYAKNEKTDLTKDELETLRQKAEEWIESL